MNVCLDSDPSARELMYSVQTRHSHQRRPPVYTRAIMDFNFSAAPLGSEPCIVTLMFENTGTVPTEWQVFTIFFLVFLSKNIIYHYKGH